MWPRVVVAIVLGALAAFAPVAMQARAAAVTVGGPFDLVTADGKAVTDKTYAGKWLLVYFGFTYCPNSCPTALLDITQALKLLGPDAEKLQPLFITIDPKRDTPNVLHDYMSSFDPHIVALTGTAEQIAAVAKEYGAYYAPYKTGPGPTDYLMDHSTYLYAIDPHGKFVRGFDGDIPADRLAEALKTLMSKSGGAARQAGNAGDTHH